MLATCWQHVLEVRIVNWFAPEISWSILYAFQCLWKWMCLDETQARLHISAQTSCKQIVIKGQQYVTGHKCQDPVSYCLSWIFFHWQPKLILAKELFHLTCRCITAFGWMCASLWFSFSTFTSKDAHSLGLCRWCSCLGLPCASFSVETGIHCSKPNSFSTVWAGSEMKPSVQKPLTAL